MKPAIPSPAGSSDERVLRPVKETLDILTGARSGELAELPTTASKGMSFNLKSSRKGAYFQTKFLSAIT
jgi:hypothetical protein